MYYACITITVMIMYHCFIHKIIMGMRYISTHLHIVGSTRMGDIHIYIHDIKPEEPSYKLPMSRVVFSTFTEFGGEQQGYT